MDAMVFIKQHKKEFITAVMLILLGACGNAVMTQEKPYDPYADRVGQVDNAIQEMINNPSKAANNAAYNVIFMQNAWAGRQTGERNELFKEYLGECDNVRLAALHGENVDTSKMDGLRNKFN
jgi:hypothetical protein